MRHANRSEKNLYDTYSSGIYVTSMNYSNTVTYACTSNQFTVKNTWVSVMSY